LDERELCPEGLIAAQRRGHQRQVERIGTDLVGDLLRQEALDRLFVRREVGDLDEESVVGDGTFEVVGPKPVGDFLRLLARSSEVADDCSAILKPPLGGLHKVRTKDLREPARGIARIPFPCRSGEDHAQPTLSRAGRLRQRV
jgi:hypothetical protein